MLNRREFATVLATIPIAPGLHNRYQTPVDATSNPVAIGMEGVGPDRTWYVKGATFTGQPAAPLSALANSVFDSPASGETNLLVVEGRILALSRTGLHCMEERTGEEICSIDGARRLLGVEGDVVLFSTGPADDELDELHACNLADGHELWSVSANLEPGSTISGGVIIVCAAEMRHEFCSASSSLRATFVGRQKGT